MNIDVIGSIDKEEGHHNDGTLNADLRKDTGRLNRRPDKEKRSQS